MERPKIVVGLDLSLRATGMCSIAMDWSQALDERVVTDVCGEDLTADADHRARLDRMKRIAEAVVQFIQDSGLKIRPKTLPWTRAVFVEEMAFGQAGAHAREVAELTGIVKLRVLEAWGVYPVPVVASRARKVLLQKLPRKDVKKFVLANVRRLPGADRWADAQADAFVVANMGVMISGGTAMTFSGNVVEPTHGAKRSG